MLHMRELTVLNCNRLASKQDNQNGLQKENLCFLEALPAPSCPTWQ